MKQLTKNLLKFNFKGIDLADVSKVEFAFAQNVGESPLKVDTYPDSDSVIPISDNALGVLWTAGETELFKAGEPFFADVRITQTVGGYQPETNIVRLIMKPTLFEKA